MREHVAGDGPGDTRLERRPVGFACRPRALLDVRFVEGKPDPSKAVGAGYAAGGHMSHAECSAVAAAVALLESFHCVLLLVGYLSVRELCVVAFRLSNDGKSPTAFVVFGPVLFRDVPLTVRALSPPFDGASSHRGKSVSRAIVAICCSHEGSFRVSAHVSSTLLSESSLMHIGRLPSYVVLKEMTCSLLQHVLHGTSLPMWHAHVHDRGIMRTLPEEIGLLPCYRRAGNRSMFGLVLELADNEFHFVLPITRRTAPAGR